MAEEVKFIFTMDDQFSAKAKQAEVAVGGLESKLNKLGGLMATAFSIQQVVGFEKSAIEAYGRFEQFQVALTTLLNGNERAANLLNEKLVDLAKTTPFELTQVQDATKQLLAYGFTSTELIGTMKTLGDVTSGIGAPLGDIAYLYGTLKTSGRVTLMDLRQFAGRGIPIYETLAKRLNTTTANINKMASDSKLSFKDIEGAFKDMTGEGGRFFGMMENQSKTLNGQLSNMSDSWEQLKISIGESQSGIIKSTVSMVSEMISEINNAIKAQSRLDKAFKQGGAKEFSVWNKLGMGNGGDQQLNYIKDLRLSEEVSELVKKNSDSTLGIAEAQVTLSNNIARINQQFKSGTLDLQEYTRKISILRSGKADLSAQLLELNKKKAGEKGGKNIDKESAKVKQQHYTNITINIHDGLVHEFNVNTATIGEGAQSAKAIVLKGLIEAVNDSQIIAAI